MKYQKHLELTDEQMDEIAHWFDGEIINHLAERSEWIHDIMNQQYDYFATPMFETNNYPIVGASSLIIPVIAIAVEALHSRTMMTLYAIDQFVSVRAAGDYEKLNAELEAYLDHRILNEMSFREKTESSLLENVKFGFCAGETGYQYLERTGYRNGKKFNVVVKDGQFVDSIPIANLMVPFDSRDTQSARWVAKWFHQTETEVRILEENGYFFEDTYEHLENAFRPPRETEEGKVEEQADELAKREPVWPERIDFYLAYTDYMIDDELRAICFVYQRDCRKIVAIWDNPFDDLRRPFRTGVFFPLENRITGIGICKQLEQIQLEVTTQHRQRIDNATIANMRMFKARLNSGVEEDESIYPGKIWYLHDMADLESFQAGEVYPSSYNNENQAIIYGQQRSGVNEITLGQPNVGSPGTAADSMARVQESSRKFDYTYSNQRNYLGLLVSDIVCNEVQFGPRVNKLIYDSSRAGEIEAFFKQPYELFRNKVICDVRLVGQNRNRFLEQQNWTQVSGLLQQYYTSIQQLAQQVDPTLSSKIARQGLVAATEAMKQVLEGFNVRNPEKILFALDKALREPQPITPGEAVTNPSSGPGRAESSIITPNAPTNLEGSLGSLLLGGGDLQIAGTGQ